MAWNGRIRKCWYLCGKCKSVKGKNVLYDLPPLHSTRRRPRSEAGQLTPFRQRRLCLIRAWLMDSAVAAADGEMEGEKEEREALRSSNPWTRRYVEGSRLLLSKWKSPPSYHSHTHALFFPKQEQISIASFSSTLHVPFTLFLRL